MSLSRRTALIGLTAGAAALTSPNVLRAQAKLQLKCGNNMPVAHPVNTRLQEAFKRIAARTDGKIEIQLFPNSQLGADDSMLGQLRAGGLEFHIQSGLVVSSLVPVAALNGVGFIFPDYATVWKAMDGPVGAHIIEGFAKANIVAFEKIWDNGFRQMTSSTRPIDSPKALAGLKMRVPPGALWTSMFTSLGASPVTIPWAEIYVSLQTGVADGQETPLAVLHLSKVYEVQKFLSLTNHMWDGLWFLASRRSWSNIPAELQAIIRDEINQSAVTQRGDVAKLNGELQQQIAANGLKVTEVNSADFRATLQKSGFYGNWKQKFGDASWSVLESITGPIS